MIKIENNELIIRSLNKNDINCLKLMRVDSVIYHFEPTFLIELQGEINAAIDVISNMDLLIDRQIILGIFKKEDPSIFLGLAEFYDYKSSGVIISIGYRLLSKYWRQGFGTSCVSLLLDFIRNNLSAKIVTAHVLANNLASKKCLEKNGFTYLLNKKEDWGHKHLEDTDVYTYDFV